MDKYYGYLNSRTSPLIIIGALIIFGLIGYRLIKIFLEFSYNNSQEILKREVKIIGKRMNMSSESGTLTEYYTTFEFEDGERLELKIKDKVYGLIAEDDFGVLEYQGKRFIEFKRS